MSEIVIAEGYSPGVIGDVTSLHARYYHEHWGFGAHFEATVAAGLAEFLQRYEPNQDGFWTASAGGRIVGSVAIDGKAAATDGAHLRWFFVSDGLRGQGVGSRLLGTAKDFCRDKSYRRIHLSTFRGLDAAKHLYEREGFVLVEECLGSQWGTEVSEQRWECELLGD